MQVWEIYKKQNNNNKNIFSYHYIQFCFKFGRFRIVGSYLRERRGYLGLWGNPRRCAEDNLSLDWLGEGLSFPSHNLHLQVHLQVHGTGPSADAGAAVVAADAYHDGPSDSWTPFGSLSSWGNLLDVWSSSDSYDPCCSSDAWNWFDA